ncbi:MAG: uncharacterized protein QG555_969 [Thermodesulfobacteriota bacterium]|nr:uncharacterized protein [Thermodesulfobacteriota bacterium]
MRRLLKEQEYTPPCNIRIDKEGVWYYQGAEMFRREFVNYFYQNLHLDETGRYVIILPDDRCYVDVEDAAYIINAVDYKRSERGNGKGINLLLCDETSEALDPRTLWIGPDNVMYCRVREDTFKARFSRAAYYQLAEHIEHDEVQEMFYLKIDGQHYNIETKFI